MYPSDSRARHTFIADAFDTTEGPCASCLEAGIVTPATTRSTNPDWSAIPLCEECAAEYNSRPPIDDRHIREE